MERVARVGEQVGRWFPAIVVLAGAVAVGVPGLFDGWTAAVPWLLALIMLGMGMTLRPVDLAYVARRPAARGTVTIWFRYENGGFIAC